MHWFITLIRCKFSKAAATLSLSASCLLTACSEACVPGLTSTLTLNLDGKHRNSFTRMDKPINVAMLQCGIVGVYRTWIVFLSLSTCIKFSSSTCSSSRVSGCSGSLMLRIKSETVCKNHWHTAGISHRKLLWSRIRRLPRRCSHRQLLTDRWFWCKCWDLRFLTPYFKICPHRHCNCG